MQGLLIGASEGLAEDAVEIVGQGTADLAVQFLETLEGAGALLRRNLLIYGVGGLIAPFIGIKIIDVFLSTIGLT